MSRKRILLVILLAVLIIVAGFAVYITSPSWFPRGTSLEISPANSSAKPGDVMVLVATVMSGSTEITGGTVTWTTSMGTLDKSTGSSVLFTAPSVGVTTAVTITASFSGIGVYQASSATANVNVIGSTTGTTTTTTTSGLTTTTTTTTQTTSILPDLYTMTFQSATMTNLKFLGPVTMNGTQVTMVTGDEAEMFGYTLNHLGLNAAEMSVDGLVLYTTYISLSPSGGGAATVINGSQTVNTGPTSSAAFGNGTFYVARMEGSSANATGLISYGQYIGGNEPYVPNLITSPLTTLSNTYAIQGPVTWGHLINTSSSISIGQVVIQQFSFEHPSEYSLDRQTKTFTSTNLWLLKSSTATAINVTAYMIYFKCTALGAITVVSTGQDLMRNVIPLGYSVGSGLGVNDLAVHAVYFSATTMALGSFVLSIEQSGS
jgi:hypothetical protein